MNAPDLLECAPDLIELPGIHSIRWRNREVAHIVTINWSGSTPEQKEAIQKTLDRMVHDWPNRAFIVRIEDE